jgi:hypothetical protein
MLQEADMSGKREKELRRENTVTITLDIDTAQWLVGFFGALLAPLEIKDLSRDTLNARAVMDATQKGLHDEQV